MSASPVLRPAPAERQRSTADLVVAVVLLLVAVLSALLATYAGLFLVMATDSCGIQGECSDLGVAAGVGVAALGPWVGLLALGVWTVVRLVRRRLAWWTALLALAAVPAVWAVGAALVWLGVGGASA